MTRIPIPIPSYFDKLKYLGFLYGSRRWRSLCGERLYTWDELHGEIEVFTKRGKHLASIDALTGCHKKNAVKGRIIDV